MLIRTLFEKHTKPGFEIAVDLDYFVFLRIFRTLLIALQRFVDQSLDSTRAELSQLLYPCFAHFYLKLIINDHAEMARKFYNEFIPKFGFPLKIYSDWGQEFNNQMFKELHQLLGINVSLTSFYSSTRLKYYSYNNNMRD